MKPLPIAHCSLVVSWLLVTLTSVAAEPEITRQLPPVGIEIPEATRTRLERQIATTLQPRLSALRDHPLLADAEIYVKAVDFALRHREFYDERELPRADAALATADERIEQLSQGRAPWTSARGLVVRGYRSRIDGSAQPYGLVIPEDLPTDQPVPLYVWLHGRGDKATDLHFIHERQSKVGQIQPPGAIVLHPFGRHCVGFKSAGETDVLEAIAHVQSQYPIDAHRIVLMGFSMGGAGTWHLGAHYADHFVAMSPGAGFAETARYQNLQPANYPPWYEQKLWGAYDVPGYARNLFNLPVVAYSGEEDKQIQAARIMEEAFREHGQTLTHIIGPGMGHKYHPDSLQQILHEMAQAAQAGLNRGPSQVSLQTRTLRYNRMHWVEILGLHEHWLDSRVDARRETPRRVVVTTQNVNRLALATETGVTLEIDGDTITPPSNEIGVPWRVVLQRGQHWSLARDAADTLRKTPGLQGPIDDVFLEPFLIVAPSRSSSNPAVDAWVKFELQHQIDRWRALFRGEPRVKRDVDVTAEDERQFHLVAWGTPESNRFLRELAEADSGFPIRWTAEQVVVGARTFDARNHVPVFIYPRAGKYLVVNSGPTFREGHDRTNSLQNPKLPDWAVIDIRQPPNNVAPGLIVAADFFDEQWQLKK